MYVNLHMNNTSLKCLIRFEYTWRFFCFFLQSEASDFSCYLIFYGHELLSWGGESFLKKTKKTKKKLYLWGKNKYIWKYIISRFIEENRNLFCNQLFHMKKINL